MRKRGVLLLSLCVGFCVACIGCDNSKPDSSSSKSESASSASSSSAEDSTGVSSKSSKRDSSSTSGAKSGYASGRVTMPDGKPITLPNAKITVGLFGTDNFVEYFPKVQADGSFKQKLAEGNYIFKAPAIQVLFEGQNYQLWLDPVGGTPSSFSSEDGIEQDYVWKIQGPRPESTGEEWKPANWYGGIVCITYTSFREDLKKSVPLPTPGTKCRFTLTPKSKLIDGSEGKALTLTREVTAKQELDKRGFFADIPIALYTIKGEEELPGGAKRPLLFAVDQVRFADSIDIQFEPNVGLNTVWPKAVTITPKTE